MTVAIKSGATFVVAACLAMASPAAAQSDQAMIDRALLGAPAGMVRQNASVV